MDLKIKIPVGSGSFLMVDIS